MVQLGDDDILSRIVAGEVPPEDGIAALFDRRLGWFTAKEGRLLDYKQAIDVGSSSSVAELGRDILGFSNTDGGILVIGVDDDKTLSGHERVGFRSLARRSDVNNPRFAIAIFDGTGPNR
jgi:hypothetical protein